MVKHKNTLNPLRYNTAKQKALKKQAQKEINRIKHTISRAEQRGFSFNMGDSLKLPSVLSSRTIQRLKNIKGENLYKHATYKTPEGKTVSGKSGRKMERSAASRKGAATKRANKDKQTLSAFYRNIVNRFLGDMGKAVQYHQSFNLKTKWETFISNLENAVGLENTAFCILGLYENEMVQNDPSVFYEPDKAKSLMGKMLNWCYKKGYMDEDTYNTMNDMISNFDEMYEDYDSENYYEDYLDNI